MVLCLICWGVYAGVKKAHQTIEERKEKKRIKNGEKASPSDEKAILASSSSANDCTCSTLDGEHKTCRSCKAAFVEEVPPPYHEATSGSSRAVMTTAA